MARLLIKKFSCIDSAEMNLSGITILIGPQASGKSIISKLIYFMADILSKHISAIRDGEKIEEYIDSIEQEFFKLFPPIAWGREKFIISLTAGDFCVRISRAKKKKTTKKYSLEGVDIVFSDFFKNHYNSSLQSWNEQKQKSRKPEGRDVPDIFREHQRFWQFQEVLEKNLRSALENDYVGAKLFIPAGRSFFTSMRKAFAVFEHGGVIDPITMNFGRLFSNLTDRSYFPLSGDGASSAKLKDELMQKFFGGKIVFEKEQGFIDSLDGRRIPFAYLSSGQQELLPLWLTLDFIENRNTDISTIFIEEPEAHLFPDAQSHIIRYLVSLSNSRKTKRRILITTHSPYVLSCLNNLLKAGMIAKSAKNDTKSKLEKIIQSNYWLDPAKFNAFAIIERRVVNIIDDDGLINGDYLDKISDFINNEFSALLDLE